MTTIRRLLLDSSGQDLIEYAVLTAFIALAIIAVLGSLALSISNTFGRIGDAVR